MNNGSDDQTVAGLGFFFFFTPAFIRIHSDRKKRLSIDKKNLKAVLNHLDVFLATG